MVKLTIQTMLTNQANASFQKILIQSMHFIMYNMTGKINSTYMYFYCNFTRKQNEDDYT